MNFFALISNEKGAKIFILRPYSVWFSIFSGERGITGVTPEREGFKKKQMTHSLLSFVIFPISPKRAWLMLKMTNAPSGAFVFFGGERGIRTPGPITVNGFQDRRVKPLCHFSGGKSRIILWILKKNKKKSFFSQENKKSILCLFLPRNRKCKPFYTPYHE